MIKTSREILFRGRSTADGEWVEGGYFELHGNVYICEVRLQDWGMVKVMPETVGQYTGILDKYGVKIFEGDILEAKGRRVIKTHDFSDARKFVSPTIKDTFEEMVGRFKFVVLWQQNFAQWKISSIESDVHIETDVSKREYTIIGNVHNNKNLLKNG